MQLNTKSIKNHFEKSMDKYNENAIVQTNLAKKLATETSHFQSEYNSILELGCGTGILTQNIKENFSFENYYANDLTEKSKKYVDKIIPHNQFIHGNAIKIKPPKKVDLIISNAMFQWFSNFDEIAKHCQTLLNKDGILAFTTFGTQNFSEIKDLTGLTLKYISTDEIVQKLTPDYDVLHTEEYLQILNFKTPLELLAHLKNTGVNSLATRTWTIKEVKVFCEKYLQKYNSAQLTYNPIIIIAKIK